MRRPVPLVLTLIALIALALLRPSPAQPAPSGDSDAAVIHVLNRLGYGARPGDVARVRAMGLDVYVAQQLKPEAIDDAACEKRFDELRTLRMSSAELARTYPNRDLVRRAEQMAEQGDARSQMILQALAPANERGDPREILIDLTSQKLIRAVHSERQLYEVMVDFWMNHFNIYWPKNQDRVLLTAFERDVIRPRALGRFRDLLRATAHSPAMLVYLDNWLSTSETAKAAPNSRRGNGLNENYAREIMELHTLGVEGGYTQKDVVEVARCFTGWTVQIFGRARSGEASDSSSYGAFVFRRAIHDDSAKVVLGKKLPAGGGEADGNTVIDVLARHPSTARFISLKLCRRFVSDDPPAALVDRVARVFRETDGDIRAVVRAIVTSPEFRAPSMRGAKIKNPFELMVSAIRTLNGTTSGGRVLANALRSMGMPLYLCQPPTGYADRAEAWVSSGSLLERMSFAVDLTSGRLRGVTADPTPLMQGLPRDTDAMVAELGVRLVGKPLSETTLKTLRKTVRDEATTNPIRQTAGLIIGSPEFQRR